MKTEARRRAGAATAAGVATIAWVGGTSATAASAAAASTAASIAAVLSGCCCCCLAMHSLLTHRVGNRGGGCTGVREKSVSQWNSHAQSLTQWKPCPRMKATTSGCSA